MGVKKGDKSLVNTVTKFLSDFEEETHTYADSYLLKIAGDIARRNPDGLCDFLDFLKQVEKSILKPRDISKVLFVDIDGVLCFDRRQELIADEVLERGLEIPQLNNLKRIQEATGCRIVLSSVWRKFADHRAVLNRAFLSMGIIWNYDRTIQIHRPYGKNERPDEIVQWVDGTPGITKWAVVDDEKLDELGEHFFRARWVPERVYTPEVITMGLNDDLADRIIEYLNGA